MQTFMTGLDHQTYDNAIDDEQTKEHVTFSLICKLRVGKHDISIITDGSIFRSTMNFRKYKYKSNIISFD